MEYKRVDYKIDNNIESSDNDIVEALIIDIKFSSSSQLDQENININIFITFYKIIYQAKLITANIMTKRKLCHAFQKLININMVNMKILDWVKQDKS